MNRVLIRKSDGHPIEYQSGNAPLGTLTQNAVNAGLNPADYEEKYITDADYAALAETKINKPARDVRKVKKDEAVARFLLESGWKKSVLDDLKEALK